jgi:hypothetical protein
MFNGRATRGAEPHGIVRISDVYRRIGVLLMLRSEVVIVG